MAALARFAERVLGVDVARQHHDLWCWAACASAVSRFYDAASTWTQCRVAGAVLGSATCCDDDPLCNVKAAVYVALDHTGNLAARVPGPVPRRRLVRELARGRPIVVRVQYPDVGHFLVVDGSRWLKDRRIRVHDPGYPRTVWLSVRSLRHGYDTFGTWTHTYQTCPR
jgi:Papain-like cysteine protease AvrRpt2